MWEGTFESTMYLPLLGFFPSVAGKIVAGDVDGDTSAKGTVTYTGIYRNGQQMVVDLEADTTKPGTFMATCMQSGQVFDFCIETCTCQKTYPRSADPFVTVRTGTYIARCPVDNGTFTLSARTKDPVDDEAVRDTSHSF
jgi:hypothetical protein